MRSTTRMLVLLAIVASACAAPEADDSDVEPPADDAVAVDTLPEPPPGSSREPILATSVGCDEGFHWDQPDCDPARSVELDQIISGGPPPDGIPPIDDPVYESAEDAAEWLQDTSPVMVVDVDDDVRLYPLAILTWHEIVNDTIGGLPVVVTYCPLCNSALVFDRRVEGPDGIEVLDFGTSGRLWRSNLVMYDRQHLNLWTQFEGEGIVGEEFLGTRLARLPAWLLGFGEATELHPDAQVLSRETGHRRDYGRNPYTGYDAPDNDPFLFEGEIDERHPPMTRFVGVAGDEAVAVELALLAEQRAIEVELDGRTLVLLWAPGQASALDTAAIDEGRDVGQTATFVAELDGEPVELEAGDEDGRFVDANSGSTFDLRGRALDGPLEGQRLEAVPHDDTLWFVWVVFRPDTEVVAA